jgi:hypothetical protein
MMSFNQFVLEGVENNLSLPELLRTVFKKCMKKH